MPSQQELLGEVAAALEPFHRGNDQLGVLLALCVGRLMLKKARAGEDWLQAFPEEQIRHAADWLKAAIANDADWLRNVDQLGRPKKLMKFGTMEGLVGEADRAMVIEAQKLRNVKITARDETFVAELADGMYLVRLETPAALDRESSEMQHCIGNGGYDELLEDGQWEYLSLRDRNGKAHATLEIDLEENALEQLQGKQNKAPLREYVAALAPYLKTRRLRTSLRASELGHVVDINGRWHPLDNLPDGIKVPGDLALTRVDIKRLPASLTVAGCLYLAGSGIIELPPGLVVGKTLFINNTSLKSLPHDILVRGGISMANSQITYLPDCVDDRMRIVTSDGPMSAAKFRERYHRPDIATAASLSP